jgi:FAD/FMN-containing dehydrogenase
MENIEALKQEFTGEIILPQDSNYDQARKTFIRDGSPSIILRPISSADVATAVRYAKSNALALSVRSGGHSGAGFSTNDGGLVIDLSALNKIEIIDQNKHIVHIGSGAHWGDVAKTLGNHGMALSSGDTTTVGVGGLTLGGGIGWMVRKYGLAIDSLIAAEIVTANGEIMRISDTEHADLFWAIRGGGGNFGVATSFEFVAHPVKRVFAGSITYALDDVAKLLKEWRDCMRTASEDLTTMFLIMPSFGGNPSAAIILCCYASDDEPAAKKAITPFLEIGAVLQQNVIVKEYAAVLEEAHAPQGVRIIVNNAFAKEFSDDLILAIATECKETPPILQIRSLGGAMKRISNEATAFAHRESEVLIVSPTFVSPIASTEEVNHALKAWEIIAPLTEGSYVNFFSEHTGNELNAAYPDMTHERLRIIKKLYDPENLFNQNYNIKPAE